MMQVECLLCKCVILSLNQSDDKLAAMGYKKACEITFGAGVLNYPVVETQPTTK